VPVSHDALAYRQAETFCRTDALCGDERLKDVRKILRWDARAIVDELHDSLIIVALGLNSDFTTAIYRIRCVIEQVDPHLREFARIAAHVTAFARKILRDTNVLELVIKDAQRAPDLLMHVNIREFCTLLSRDGTHGSD
jgi:hypothetical protein